MLPGHPSQQQEFAEAQMKYRRETPPSGFLPEAFIEMFFVRGLGFVTRTAWRMLRVTVRLVLYPWRDQIRAFVADINPQQQPEENKPKPR